MGTLINFHIPRKKEKQTTQSNLRPYYHACYRIADNCRHPKDTYANICLKCGDCGRKFD